MLVELRQAGEADAHLLWKMQIRSFEPILQRYHNDTTSPARETELLRGIFPVHLARVMTRLLSFTLLLGTDSLTLTHPPCNCT